MGRACPFVGSPRWTVSPSFPRSVPQRADAGHEPEHEVIPGHLRMPGMYHLVIHRKCQSSAVIVSDEFDEFPLVVALDVGRLTLRALVLVGVDAWRAEHEHTRRLQVTRHGRH